jgi:hypothetical protein
VGLGKIFTTVQSFILTFLKINLVLGSFPCILKKEEKLFLKKSLITFDNEHCDFENSFQICSERHCQQLYVVNKRALT